ncbi:P-loop containing nucleoside triphosphate hydrolase protein [Limtongia smithiae]|uniref:P-loop containing nucleoside triphosphate hydrolase protein n=1 Tax=Limtongia smithiae TaxID=1125753 RepID=UPI0034CFC6E8
MTIWHQPSRRCHLLVRKAGQGIGDQRIGVSRMFSASASAALAKPIRDGPTPTMPRIARGLPTKSKLPGVDKVIAVSSAKGGVGKSTVAVNLALGLALRHQKRVGILDTDIFGPSVPKLLNLVGADPGATPAGRLIPVQNYGIKAMSLGFLLPDQDSPVVWRGLMVMKALQQLLHDVEWGGLDILVLDMPPGTGDVQLTITQQVVVDGAVVVSTPQDIALIDAVKGINMFRKVDVPVFGTVQNMSVFVCPNCHHEEHVFGTDGVERESERLGTEVLTSIPLHARICELSDKGTPVVVADPDSRNAEAYFELADKVMEKLYI